MYFQRSRRILKMKPANLQRMNRKVPRAAGGWMDYSIHILALLLHTTALVGGAAFGLQMRS